MIRIKCKTPSTGKPKNYTAIGVGTTWTTLAEAPDFSVTDTNNIYAPDPADPNRGIRPGEIFFLTPIYARNHSDADCWIEVRLASENGGNAIECPGRMNVPAGDTALIPVQGRSLLKRVATNNRGDRLEVRAEIEGVIDLWATAEEKPSAEHIGVM